MSLKNICILLSVFFLSFQLKAKEPDTLSVDVEDLTLMNNIDELLNLWYVKHSLNPYYDSTAYLIDTTISDTAGKNILYADSVYINRLAQINTLVGLPYNEKVKAFIEAYTNKHRKRVEIMLGIADYYFPMIEQIFDSYNMPLELKYMAVIESALNPNAVSRAGATGLWQFMFTTGKLYHLEVNTFVDERRDPIKATHAAAQFLGDLYAIYHDWILAIAAYNCGPGNVNKAVKRCKGNNNYWEIYHYLPKETRGYVPAYIAAVYLFHYYKEHNLTPKKINIPTAVDTLMITEDLHFLQVAKVLNVNPDMIRDLNPQYRKDIIPAKNETFPLRLPSDLTTKFIELSDSIFSYHDSIYFPVKSSTIPPKNVSYSAYSSYSGDTEPIYYKVKAGDNLGAIAGKYHVNIQDLRTWNNIHRNLIRAGQKLVIYVPKNKVDSYNKQATPTVKPSTQTESQSSDASSQTNDDYIYYKVKAGDNLWEIAKRYPGVSNTDIMQLNNITNAKSLTPGQVLKIKKKS